MSVCSRAWQAEAAEDRRLSATDIASFERHAASCADCARERAALADLRAIAQRMPVAERQPLRSRKLRNELLRRANEISVLGAGVPRLRFRAALAACLLIGIGALLAFGWRFSSPERAVVAREPVYRVEASRGARWRVARPGPALSLALGPGEFTISVDELGSGQRFLVELPDGELEVKGTRFVVERDSARTRRVAVEEGAVALRLRGLAEVALVAGQAWPAASAIPPPPSLGERGPPASIPVPSASPSAVAPGRTARIPAPAPASQGASAASALPSASASTLGASEDFARAMAAFSSGDFATAERLFVEFEAEHPGNAHVEDTRFLRALSRLRRGDEDGARALARDYLHRYPNGFRAVEARRMAR